MPNRISPKQLNRFLKIQSLIESSGGANVNHTPITQGIQAGTRAYGKYGLMPNTISEMAHRYGKNQPDYAELENLDPGTISDRLAAQPELEEKIAKDLATKLLRQQQGDEPSASYGWQFGHNKVYDPLEIQDEPRVQKYLKLKKMWGKPNFADGGEVLSNPEKTYVGPFDTNNQKSINPTLPPQEFLNRILDKTVGDEKSLGDEIIPTDSPIDLLAAGVGSSLAKRAINSAAPIVGNEIGTMTATKNPILTEFPQRSKYSPELKLTNAPKEFYGPNKQIKTIANNYARQKGLEIPEISEYSKIVPEKSTKIAEAYENMVHNPNDPKVKSAYKALINETMGQYKAIKDSGLKIEAIKPNQSNPYPNGSKQVFDDIKNGHLWFYPTEQGFGSGAVNLDHPLLTKTNEKIDGQSLLSNDIFRIVHDVFGHAKEGVGFGPHGEENAWKIHKKMYSPEATKALTTETRGQNSWVNFGPYGNPNRTNPKMTKYADQKAGLLPNWTSED